MSSKNAILTRVRSALRDVPAGVSAADDVVVPWTYGAPTDVPDLVERFVDRVVDYRATVVRCGPEELAATVVDALRTHGAKSVVIPVGAPEDWRRAAALAGFVVSTDEPALSHSELDSTDAVVTASRVSIAETGTIVLDHEPDQGRRALSLVPDVHVCVVGVDQIVTDVPEAVAALQAAGSASRPQTWISGGSATSDIELSRVEGVHGPRTLHVVLVG